MSLYVYLLYFENNLVIFYTTNFFEIIIFTYTYNLTKLYLSKYNSSFNYLLFPHIRIIVSLMYGKMSILPYINETRMRSIHVHVPVH